MCPKKALYLTGEYIHTNRLHLGPIRRVINLCAGLELLEVFDEHARKLLSGLVILLSTSPRLAGVQNCRVDARNRGGEGHVEDGMKLHRRLGDRAVEDVGDDVARVGQIDALAHTIRAAHTQGNPQ